MKNLFLFKACAPLLCLFLLCACEQSNTPAPTADINDLSDIPDGSLFEDIPLDPKATAKQRELANLDNLGLEFEAVSVSTIKELESLGLKAYNEDSAPFLKIVLATLVKGVQDADYLLSFDSEAAIVPDLRNEEGLPLIAISRVDREIPTCTTRVSTAIEKGEDLIGYGARAGNLTEGICGGIAAAHSFLDLNLVARNKLVAGGFFKERPLKKIQGRNRKQMTKKRLLELHKAAGATTCRTNAGDFKTNNRGGLNRFNSELSGFVNDQNNNWDCTLFVRTSKGGKDVLAHFEHIASVTANGGVTSINTTNGFDQGNQKDKVPVNPGSNTWTSQPGGNPPFKLTASTGRNGANLVKGTPNVGVVNYLCCRKP